MTPPSPLDGKQSVLLTSFCHEQAAAPFLEALAAMGVRAWTEGGENEAPVGVCVAPADVPAAAEALRRHVEARVAELEAFDGAALGGVDADWSETPWHEVTSFPEEGEADIFASILASHNVPCRLSSEGILPRVYGYGRALDRRVGVAVPEPFLAWAVAWVEAGQQRNDLEELEQLLEGHTQTGPLAMRLERLVTKLLPSGIQGTGVSVPAATLVKVRLLQPLAARFCKTGDKVGLELVDDLRVQGTLVAPRGSRVAAHVQSVEGPRSFGRPSEVKVTFEYLETLGMEQIPVLVGEAAKNATKLDKSLVGAAGASALGMVLLGPVGLAGGFLVRGDDKTVPAGTQFYLETGQAVSVLAYTVPATLGGGVTPTPAVTSTGAINP